MAMTSLMRGPRAEGGAEPKESGSVNGTPARKTAGACAGPGCCLPSWAGFLLLVSPSVKGNALCVHSEDSEPEVHIPVSALR